MIINKKIKITPLFIGRLQLNINEPFRDYKLLYTIIFIIIFN